MRSYRSDSPRTPLPPRRGYRASSPALQRTPRRAGTPNRKKKTQSRIKRLQSLAQTVKKLQTDFDERKEEVLKRKDTVKSLEDQLTALRKAFGVLSDVVIDEIEAVKSEFDVRLDKEIERHQLSEQKLEKKIDELTFKLFQTQESYSKLKLDMKDELKREIKSELSAELKSEILSEISTINDETIKQQMGIIQKERQKVEESSSMCKLIQGEVEQMLVGVKSAKQEASSAISAIAALKEQQKRALTAAAVDVSRALKDASAAKRLVASSAEDTLILCIQEVRKKIRDDISDSISPMSEHMEDSDRRISAMKRDFDRHFSQISPEIIRESVDDAVKEMGKQLKMEQMRRDDEFERKLASMGNAITYITTAMGKSEDFDDIIS
ncbi:hypothetical protein ADUPG1_009679 [Aduncisulcus paluster]|uniref:Uncharacterized protein n=1 Tax=Aduncisulcus paluster TaxID=2918883 RepID=A0ABQ5L0A8_9EUKA|nr:hypothetical protein ADUPG1_009679 [Aduncisulcus paluster]